MSAVHRALPALALGLLAGACPRAPATAAPPRPERLEALEAPVAAAIEDALAGVAAAPTSAEAWSRLAMVYHANRLPVLALPCYERALALGARAPAELARDRYRRALALLDLGRAPEALADLAEARRLAPGAAVPPWREGLVRLEEGALGPARERLEEACRANAGFVPARIGLARVDLLEDRPRDAIAELEGVLAEMPRNRHAKDLLRTARLQAGLEPEDAPERARSETFEPQAYDPWEEEVLALRAETRLARAIRLLARDKADRALPLLEAERDLGHVDGTVLGNLAEAYAALGRTADARAALEQALRQAPENVRFHAELSDLCEREGRPAEALRWVERALAFAPERAELHRRAAALLLALGRAPQATAALREALRLDGRDPRLWTRLAQAELAQGDARAAEEACARALALDPDAAEPLLALCAAQLAASELERAAETLARAARHPRADGARVAELGQRLERARAGGGGG